MLAGFSWLVTVRPWLTLLALVLVTVVLGFGTSLRAPPQETAEALPKGSSITKALTAIEESFGDSEVRVVTLLFRGDALTPDGLSQMSALLGQIASDPQVSGVLSPVDPIFGPSMLVQAMLQVPNFDSVSQDTDRRCPRCASDQRVTGRDNRVSTRTRQRSPLQVFSYKTPAMTP